MIRPIHNPYYRFVIDAAGFMAAGGLLRAYSTGAVVGCFVPKDNGSPWWARRAGAYDLDAVMTELVIPVFGVGSSGSQISGSGTDRLCTPWHHYLKLDPTAAMRGAQRTGDCVSWAIRGASDTARSFDILGRHEPETYLKRQATCGIYSGRGHTGTGASPARLSQYHVRIGIVLEQVYQTSDETYDFRDYEQYVTWGIQNGRSGVPEDLRQVTAQYGPRTTSLVAGMEELKDLLWNGYGVHCGSGIGVSDYGDPVSQLQGGWSHDMQICGYDDRPDTRKKFGEAVYFWDQSWGNWNRVIAIPEEWKPWGQGMFALSESDTWRAVQQQGTWVFSNKDGFPAQPIDNSLI
jgi:hypothetical protein